MENKIYFICTDNKQPIGGIKQLYRQVDILNKNGFNAVIVHRKKGFRHKWFQNETKIIYNLTIFIDLEKILMKKKLKPYKVFKNFFRTKYQDPIDKDGILVVPEIYGPQVSGFYKEMKKVIFNQNCYYTFNNSTIKESKENLRLLDANFLGSIVVSEDSKKYLEYTFPKSTIHRIHLGIDSNKFFYDKSLKKKQIAFMPRKLKDDIVQIVNILKIRDNLKNWTLLPIDNKTEDEVAQILNESCIFLSLNHKEGFGLPPAEAMASGCIVIGYTGQGGKEYFNPDYSFIIEEGNILEFVDKVEEVSLKLERNDPALIEMSQNASDYILNNYDLAKEEKSIVSTWGKILKFDNSNI